MRLHEVREVERPQSDVFAYTADFSHSAEWDPGVVASRQVGDGPVGVGTKFELEVKFGAGTTPMTYEIVAYEPDRRVVLVGRGDKVEAIDEIRFETRGPVTVIDYAADLTFHNYLKYFGPLLNPLLRGVGTRAMDGLQENLGR